MSPSSLAPLCAEHAAFLPLKPFAVSVSTVQGLLAADTVAQKPFCLIHSTQLGLTDGSIQPEPSLEALLSMEQPVIATPMCP